MTHNLTTSIIHEVQSLINHLHIKGRIDYKTRAFLSPKTHPGLLYSTDYEKYTNLTVLYDPLSQPMTPQRTYHHMSITSYSHTWKQSRHSPKTQDTSDTINLPNLPEGACLVTADVVSTYNNIPHREGTETGIQHIKNNIALLPENSPRPGTIQSSLNIILTNNHLQYNDMFFQQTMGTICASPYASIFMQKMESQILNHEPHYINFWCRFIDDCFFIFTHGEDKLHKVLTFMNAIHPAINFTF